MKVITEAEQFYGYIIGLQVARRAGPYIDGSVNAKLYATFEYRGKPSVWEVPDLELFKILSEHPSQMARARRENDEYGSEKLWIKKEAGLWHVDLP